MSPDRKKRPKLSRLGELLNTQKNVHFLPPPGGSPRGGQNGTPGGPPFWGVCNTKYLIYGPKTGQKRAQNRAQNRGPRGAPRAARPGPAPAPGNFPPPGWSLACPAPGGGPGGGPRQGSGEPYPRASLCPIITDPTGDALRKLHAMHRCFIPSIADMSRRSASMSAFGWVSYAPSKCCVRCTQPVAVLSQLRGTEG